MNKRIVGYVIMLACTILFMTIAVMYSKDRQDKEIEVEDPEGETVVVDAGADLIIWYNDSRLLPYLQEMGYLYSSGSSLELVQVSALGYLEKINEYNLEGKGMPDIFIMGSEMMEKAYLAGLTSPNTNQAYQLENFSGTALLAASYKKELTAYPFYFDTSYLVYNKKYVDREPKTFDDILAFAQTYDSSSPDMADSILKWDVKSLLYNYGFIGKYINLGGEDGDDSKAADLNNENLISCLQYYQALNQYFSIDAETVTAQSVLDEFTGGKTVYAILGTQALASLNESGMDYGISAFPDLTAQLKSQPLSATTVAVVNPYSKHLEKAKKFAGYITYEKVEMLYELTGLTAARTFDAYKTAGMDTIMEQYAASVSVPKLMSASDFWVQLQNMMNNVWNGMDPATELDKMESRIRSHLNIEE